jgi:hypothetical protein
MLKVEHSVVINKPVDQVWNFLTVFQNTPKWDIGVLETKQTSEGAAGLGTTFQNTGPFLGKSAVREYKVTDYVLHKKVTVKLMSPSKVIQKAEVNYTFEPANNGTKLSFIGCIEFGGFFRLIQPFLLQRAKRDGQGDLDNLKRLIESQTDDA